MRIPGKTSKYDGIGMRVGRLGTLLHLWTVQLHQSHHKVILLYLIIKFHRSIDHPFAHLIVYEMIPADRTGHSLASHPDNLQRFVVVILPQQTHGVVR